MTNEECGWLKSNQKSGHKSFQKDQKSTIVHPESQFNIFKRKSFKYSTFITEITEFV